MDAAVLAVLQVFGKFLSPTGRLGLNGNVTFDLGPAMGAVYVVG
jgi:hypothetical protein